MRWTVPLLSLTAALSLACAEPEYDDELGVTPVAVEPGALAGTFAHKSTTITLNTFPVFGEQLAGSEMYYLMERTWLPDEGTYRLRARVCDGTLFDTIGGSSFIERDTWQKIEQGGEAILEVDHALGTYDIVDYAETWGVELEDPRESPFPATQEEAEDFTDVIVDADGDGHPGVTIAVEGFASGDVFFIQRRFGEWTGAIMGEDEILGINRFEKDRLTLGSTNDLLNDQLPQRTHPDPLESWFQEVRIEDGAGCDAVLAAIEDQRIAPVRPFANQRD